MRSILTATLLALLASTAAHANDCEEKAAQIVNRLGATIKDRGAGDITLSHPALQGRMQSSADSVTISCDVDSLNTEWLDYGPPSGNYWSVIGTAGAIVTGAPSAAIEEGATACYRDKRDDPSRGDSPTSHLHHHHIRRGMVVFDCEVSLDGKSFTLFVDREAKGAWQPSRQLLDVQKLPKP